MKLGQKDNLHLKSINFKNRTSFNKASQSTDFIEHLLSASTRNTLVSQTGTGPVLMELTV